ncbi:MAG: GyrI-like domain-containing protein [Actinomycetota bacterium]
MRGLVAGTRDELKWRLMIVTADWVTDDMFERGVTTASERLGEVPGSLRLERFDEGRCVQIMYVGDYRTDATALARRLHHEFLPRHDLRPNGLHHEIYLSDPSRVAPEKMRTEVRQPVR